MDLTKIEGRAFVPKGWGYEFIIVNKTQYCGKILHLRAGKRLSWHYHNIKDETFYCLKGKVLLLYGEDKDIGKAQEITLEEGDSFYVYPGLVHKLYAFEDSNILEISSFHRDDDSIRVIKGD